MNYHAQLLAAGVSPEEAQASYRMNEILRIENFERYSAQSYAAEQSPPSDYAEQLADGFAAKYGLVCEAD